MYRLELNVGETCPDERRHCRVIGVQEALECIEAFHQTVRRWRDEECVPWGVLNPVLRSAKLTRLLAGASTGLQEDFMHLPQEA